MMTIFTILFFLLLLPVSLYFFNYIFNFFAYIIVILVFISILINLQAYLLFEKLLPSAWLSNQVDFQNVIIKFEEFYPYIYIGFILLVAFVIFWNSLKILMSVIIPLVLIVFVLHFFTDIPLLELVYSLDHASYFLVFIVFFLFILKMKFFVIKYLVFFMVILVFSWFSVFQPSFLVLSNDDGTIQNLSIFPKLLPVSEKALSNDLDTSINYQLGREIVLPFNRN